MGLFSGGQSHQGVGLESQGGDHPVLHGLDKLGNSPHNLAVFIQAEPIGLAAGDHLDVRQGLVDEFSCLVELADGHGLYGLPLKGTEAAAAQQGGHVLDGEVDPQVRLVGAVFLHGLGKGNPQERCGAGPVVFAVFGKDGGQHVLDHGEHVLLAGKGHLHIQLVKLAGRAVCPGILIPEAGGDLEVAVEAGGHQELFELLGGLGQGVELAGVVPGGDQIVPSALGGGGGEDWGGDLQEAVLRHGLTQGRDHAAPQDDIVLYCGIPQIQIAVFQPLGLVGLPAAADLEGQLIVLAAAQNVHLGGNNLNVSGGELGIFAVPLPDDALHRDGGFLVDGLEGVHHLLTLGHYLGGAIEVPDDDKGETRADNADVFHPAGDFDLLSGVRQTEFSAGVGSVLYHNYDSFL